MKNKVRKYNVQGDYFPLPPNNLTKSQAHYTYFKFGKGQFELKHAWDLVKSSQGGRGFE